MIVLGEIVFYVADCYEVMQPVKEAENLLAFNAFVYSVDVFLPIVDLRQKNNYLPTYGEYSLWYMCYFWFHLLSGWFLTTIAVAGLTGMVKKE